ncbi:MAG TPA: hydrogenase maturation protease [Pseudonocardiaceae bacterium]|nr:hydrogenase maturation protease [Pseudonocardiaceae bacterium]
MTTRVLVAGIGNIFLGDDGFGVEVVRRLSDVDLPDRVRVVDYGIRGMHLAYDLAGGDYDLTIMVDATARGEPPGTVTVLELDPVTAPTQAPAESTQLLDAHGMQPDVVLGLVDLLGAQPGRVLLVGCEPAVLDHGMALSPAVELMVDTAVRCVIDLVGRYDPENENRTDSENRTEAGVKDWC